MSKRKVLSAEELEERRRRRAAGLPGDASLHESLELKNKINDLENKLQKANSVGPTPLKLRRDLDQLFAHYDIEPAEEVLKLLLAKNEKGDFILGMRERLDKWVELMQYRMPKLRATEMSGQVDHTITYNVIMYTLDGQEVKKLESKTIDITKDKK